MGTPPGWGLEHRASNPVSIKNLTAIETSTIVKLFRPYVPVGTKRTSKILEKQDHFLTKACGNVLDLDSRGTLSPCRQDFP
jgi:hypothetical protein